MKPTYEIIDDNVYVPIGCDHWDLHHCRCCCSPCGYKPGGNGKPEDPTNPNDPGDMFRKSNYIFYGYNGTDLENIPVLSTTEVLALNSIDVEDISTAKIIFESPKEKSWAFIAIRKDKLSNIRNDIIFEDGNPFPASMADLAYDNVSVNEVLYKVFIIGARIPVGYAPIFVVKQ